MTRRSTRKLASAEPRLPRRWALGGALVGGLVGLVLCAPARWLAQGLAQSSGEHLLLADASGSVWNGSGVLVLQGGPGSRDAASLPGRLSWSVGLDGWQPVLRLRQDCCINDTLSLRVQPGWGRLRLDLPAQDQWLARVPAAWLGGLGTPWNTLQLSGSLRLSARQLSLQYQGGQWQQQGQLDFELVNIGSRVSTLAPLGSYKLSLVGDAQKPGLTRIELQTLDGALQLQGQGRVGEGQRLQFQGEASAATGRETALNNLLNIIGRRQGARSVITIG
ncbi:MULTISPECIES: type II secretion system protein N [Roseateles]|uniref:Type II secretion system protein N n=1 Tax=Roseateles flavus TaxID=3149041 RepID=A0ABV0G9Y5_9BURK|nr:type II secretion system protein N [Pelomonas sp. BJYL3]